jgi:hypothetical protein
MSNKILRYLANKLPILNKILADRRKLRIDLLYLREEITCLSKHFQQPEQISDH